MRSAHHLSPSLPTNQLEKLNISEIGAQHVSDLQKGAIGEKESITLPNLNHLRLDFCKAPRTAIVQEFRAYQVILPQLKSLHMSVAMYNPVDLSPLVLPANLEYASFCITSVQLRLIADLCTQPTIGTLEVIMSDVFLTQEFYRTSNRLFGQIYNFGKVHVYIKRSIDNLYLQLLDWRNLTHLGVIIISSTTLFALLPKLPQLYQFMVSSLIGLTNPPSINSDIPIPPVNFNLTLLNICSYESPRSREEQFDCMLDIMKALPTLKRVGIPQNQLELLPQMLTQNSDDYPHLETIEVTKYQRFDMFSRV